MAPRASDIDVIYVNGYGFPAWRGGPMFYADRVGLGAVLDRVAGLSSRARRAVAAGAAARDVWRRSGARSATRRSRNGAMR